MSAAMKITMKTRKLEINAGLLITKTLMNEWDKCFNDIMHYRLCLKSELNGRAKQPADHILRAEAVQNYER